MRIPLFGLALFLPLLQVAASNGTPALGIVPSNPKGIYQAGEKIVWNVIVEQEFAKSSPKVTYLIKRSGAEVVGRGQVSIMGGQGTIETQVTDPCTLLVEATASAPGRPVARGMSGAAVSPSKIEPSGPLPGDFDTFWNSKMAQMRSIPPEPTFVQADSGHSGVDYWKVTLKGWNGTSVQGQIARKHGENKLPALVVFQWAGVYPLKKEWVVERAAEGWLVLNVMAHDLPIDESQDFYDREASGGLSNYASIGNDDRDKSYFLRMFLGCYQAVQYLAQRPDWDGQTLVATGGSQGALQSLVAAALHPAVTGVLALVPAGCDHAGGLVKRQPGWPFWLANGGGANPKAVLEASRYFDAVNFAHRIKCPVLIGLGLIDTTSPPTGVFALTNQLAGPKEVVVMPASDHGGINNSQAPFQNRAAAWRRAFLDGMSPPIVEWK